MVKFRPYCLVEGGSMHRGRHKYWECRILTPHAEGRERFPRVTSRRAHDFPTEQTFLVKYSWLVARIVMPRCVSAGLLWASCHAAVCGLTTTCSMRLVERFVTPRCSAVRLFLRLSRPCVRYGHSLLCATGGYTCHAIPCGCQSAQGLQSGPFLHYFELGNFVP